MLGFLRPKCYHRTKDLLEQGWACLPGASSMVKGQIRQLVETCYQELKAANQLDEGGFGQKVVYKDAIDPKLAGFKACLDWARSEGVPEQDLVDWWNEPNLVRYTTVKHDQVLRVATYLANLDALQPEIADVQKREELARARVWRQIVMFGSAPGSDAQDREEWPLPWELSRRIARGVMANPTVLASPSDLKMNVRIRCLIREGRI
jgi:hypothetical protein